MRIAAVSDIHSNIFALEAVVADISRAGVDVSVNLGDILYGPIAPRATFDCLMENKFITISGNQDRQIYESTPEEISANPTMQFILDDLGEEPLSWMKSLPFDHQLTDEVYLCHGTPNSDLIYFLENVESGTAQLRDIADIEKLLGENKSDVVLCGHTHTARTVLTNTKQLIVNPASVGLPAYVDDMPNDHAIQSFSPHAAYAIIESTKFGWNVSHVKVAYDHCKAAKYAGLRKREDWVRFLETGRAYQ